MLTPEQIRQDELLHAHTEGFLTGVVTAVVLLSFFTLLYGLARVFTS